MKEEIVTKYLQYMYIFILPVLIFMTILKLYL